jgi:UDP-glucose 4-epimerase
MKILVVGGSGLLGGRIASYLEDQGHDLVLGLRDIKKKIYIKSAKINVVLIDLESTKPLGDELDGVQVVIFVAGLNSKDSQHTPDRALAVRSSGTKKLIDSAVKYGVSKFIYFSSAHVYRNPLLGIIDENTELQNENIYALSHRAGEDALISAVNRGAIDGIVLRVANGFGRPVDKRVNCWSLLINDLCRQGVEIGSLNLRGSSDQIRSFIAIDEICQAINFCIKNLPLTRNGKKEAVANLGGKKALTSLDVAHFIRGRFLSLLKIPLPIYSSGVLVLDSFDNKPPPTLIYRNDLLDWFGFVRDDKFIYEIDELITFCDQNFSPN